MKSHNKASDEAEPYEKCTFYRVGILPELSLHLYTNRAFVLLLPQGQHYFFPFIVGPFLNSFLSMSEVRCSMSLALRSECRRESKYRRETLKIDLYFLDFSNKTGFSNNSLVAISQSPIGHLN